MSFFKGRQPQEGELRVAGGMISNCGYPESGRPQRETTNAQTDMLLGKL